MSVQTLLGDLNLDIREPAVCVTLISKWVTITGTMLKKSAMVLVDQKYLSEKLISYSSSRGCRRRLPAQND
ncbi:unnamed protein product [Brassica oleracea]